VIYNIDTIHIRFGSMQTLLRGCMLMMYA